jgi:hypothetical protein
MYSMVIVPGTIISVKHNGIIPKTEKFKHPVFWRVRTDIKWTEE